MFLACKNQRLDVLINMVLIKNIVPRSLFSVTSSGFTSYLLLLDLDCLFLAHLASFSYLGK